MPGTLVVRTGHSIVGLHFVARHAVYLARGWIKSLEMLGAGPRAFSLHVDDQVVADTTSGIITRDDFYPDALATFDSNVSPSDPFLHTGEYYKDGKDSYINLNYQRRIEIVASEPPDRQNYYVKQTWAQLFQVKPQKENETKTGTDMDLGEVPCIKMFNLRSQDATATIYATKLVSSAAE